MRDIDVSEEARHAQQDLFLGDHCLSDGGVLQLFSIQVSRRGGDETVTEQRVVAVTVLLTVGRSRYRCRCLLPLPLPALHGISTAKYLPGHTDYITKTSRVFIQLLSITYKKYIRTHYQTTDVRHHSDMPIALKDG